jgi:hypothetical protein
MLKMEETILTADRAPVSWQRQGSAALGAALPSVLATL